MKLIPFIIPLMAVFTSASSVPVEYDTQYDNPKALTDSVTCSGGTNGIETKGYDTYGNVPAFPHIGGADFIKYDSTSCGSCWKLSYKANSIHVTVIDKAGSGFTVSGEALKDLGGQEAMDEGKIYASATRVDESNCRS